MIGPSKIAEATKYGVFKPCIRLCFIRFVVPFNDAFERLEIYESRVAWRENAIDDLEGSGSALFYGSAVIVCVQEWSSYRILIRECHQNSLLPSLYQREPENSALDKQRPVTLCVTDLLPRRHSVTKHRCPVLRSCQILLWWKPLMLQVRLSVWNSLTLYSQIVIF